MKITRIDLWHVAIPLPKPFYPSWVPGMPQTENRCTLIRLRTDAGLEGYSAGPAIAREREVKSVLNDPSQYQKGPFGLRRGTMDDDRGTLVVEDGNYLSARWVADAYAFGKAFAEKLQ